MDEMFRAAAMVTVFLICLGIFHYPCQSDHKLLGHPLNSTRVITLWVLAIACILFLQMCQVYSRLFWEWLVTLKFPQGEETSSPWFGGHQQFEFWSLRATLSNLPFQPPWQPLGNLSMSSPVVLPLGRLPLLLITWEVHCRSDPSSTLPHDLRENG